LRFLKACLVYQLDSSDGSPYFKSIVELLRRRGESIPDFEYTLLSVLNTICMYLKCKLNELKFYIGDFTASENESDPSTEFQRFIIISEGLFYEGVLSRTSAAQLLDSKFLNHVDIIKSVESFEKSLTRYKTTKLYMQKKFNLFREESEGFSKLIVALSQHVDSNCAASGSLYQQVSSLIGVFDLDPNRVLDVVFDRYEHIPNNPEMLNLVKRFSSETIVNILGFKLQNEYLNQRGNYNLLFIAAKLISANSFNLESLYVHVSQAIR
jgi:hypothetical protein